jgi:hypothetical protein
VILLAKLILSYCSKLNIANWNAWTLTCDAIAVTPGIEIVKGEDSCEVLGLVTEMTISLEEGDRLLRDQTAMALFMKRMKEEKKLATDVHIYALVSSAPGVPVFPIARVKANSGKANADIRCNILLLAYFLIICGLKIIGFATDGDSAFLKLLKPTVAAVCDASKVVIDLPLCAQSGADEAIRAATIREVDAAADAATAALEAELQARRQLEASAQEGRDEEFAAAAAAAAAEHRFLFDDLSAPALLATMYGEETPKYAAARDGGGVDGFSLPAAQQEDDALSSCWWRHCAHFS